MESIEQGVENTGEGAAPEGAPEPIPDIEDLEEARDLIAKAIEQGKLPVISVPERYAEVARKGLRPYTTWIGHRIIAGTILRPPYLPEGEHRHLFRIHAPSDQVEPRFTKDKRFRGVVIFRGPIPPEAIEEIQPGQGQP